MVQPARPLADAPIAALMARADDVARDWLVALVEAAPLADAPRLRVGELAATAPALVTAAVRALAGDASLEALRADPVARSAGTLAGAASPGEVAAAIEALRGALWRAALEELPRPSAALVAGLADRLAAVASVLVATALEGGGGGEPDGDVTRRRFPPRAEPPAVEPDVPDDEPAPGPASTEGPGALASIFGLRVAAPVVEVPEPERVVVSDARPRVLGETPATHLAGLLDALPDRTLAVLVAELEGVEQLLAAEAAGEVEAAVRAMTEMLRPGDSACQGGPGQLWLFLPGTGPAGARALALRLSAAVAAAASHRGVPLTVAVGTAASPADGLTAEALIERAEDGLWSARASGELPPAV